MVRRVRESALIVGDVAVVGRRSINKEQQNLFCSFHPRTMGTVPSLGQRLFVASRSIIPVPTPSSSSFLAAGRTFGGANGFRCYMCAASSPPPTIGAPLSSNQTAVHDIIVGSWLQASDWSRRGLRAMTEFPPRPVCGDDDWPSRGLARPTRRQGLHFPPPPFRSVR